jgi:hypothetical protein
VTEQLVNGAQTTLNGAIDDSDLTAVLTGTNGFPLVGDYRCLIAQISNGAMSNAELVKVTARAGTTITI